MSDHYLIVGLGNPGEKYGGTRHNVGFMCLESLASRYDIRGKGETKMNAIVGRGKVDHQKVILAQSLTYMNLSGESVARLQHFYKIPVEQTLIVLDDIDIPFGKIRFRPEGSAGSHNGMKSVIQCLGTQSIPRLRVGIGSPPPEWDLADFVLASFTPEEQAQLPQIIKTCTDALAFWVRHGTEKSMNKYNSLEIVPSQSL
jgi:peptidyl-tRNA hydrolase, PTH1 family